MQAKQAFHKRSALKWSTLPGSVAVVLLVVMALGMACLALIDRTKAGVLPAFAIALGLLAGCIQIPLRRGDRRWVGTFAMG